MWHGFEDVDARNKCGHDESEIVAVGIISRGAVNALEFTSAFGGITDMSDLFVG
jgi:hypothetical protein